MSHLTKLAPGWFGIPGTNSGLTVYASVVVPGVVVVCALPYFLIERPFMIWRPGRTLCGRRFVGPVGCCESLQAKRFEQMQSVWFQELHLRYGGDSVYRRVESL